jgi:AraC family transcriptional regulator
MADGASRDRIEKIDRAIAYIDEHILERPALGEIAAAACLSPYHFHRSFSRIVGEPVVAYVRRRALAKAAWALIHQAGESITAVALEHGFSSHSDFSRAFKSVYGMTPAEFRARAGGVFLGDDAGETIPATDVGSDFEPSIRSIGDLNLAYIAAFGLSRQRESPAIEASFARLYAFLESRRFLRKDTIFLGLTLDSPETLDFRRCRYYVCATVPEDLKGEGEIGVGTFPTAGEYACAELPEIRSAEAQKPFFGAYSYLTNRWIPAAGLALDERPFIELFSDGGRSCWKILMPVAKRARSA